ncbi:MAG: PAS domain-containing methyl-accepting chemotaxis protein [Terracidiphilus sp.]|nr:PAS domain-containing methyl-accepting chemotaxis protein [Terracidiphilus sp.]
MAVVAHIFERETLVPEHVFIYSRTDPKGRITEANQAFADLSGYAIDEMIGEPHNMVRHPDMPKAAFADMWKSLKSGRPWQGVVKNRRKDGGFYWVLATVSPVRGEGGRVTGFQSLRKRPSREQVKAAADAYRRIQQGDRTLCIEEGRALPNPSPLIRWITRPDLRFAFEAILGLAASVAGFSLEFGGPRFFLLRAFCGAAFACGALSALFMLFSTLPNLLRDMDKIDAYIDQLLSTGDFTIPFEMNQRGRSAKIARKLALLTGWVQSTIQCIHDAVVPVELGTEKIRLAVQGIDEATEAQNTATASVAAATTELDLTIREVTQHLQSTEASVQETGRRATDGADVSHRATDQMQELASVVKVASAEVEALGASSAEVGVIARVIREIANQTNLLALNASIEAARAGEAGRGFSVVANEVRSLADRTMKATAEIDALLGAIKGDSDRAIAGMRTGATQVNSGVALVQEAQSVLSGINTLMGDAVRRVSEIATASSQQAEAMSEISSNITHVAAMTGQNAGLAKQTAQLIGDLVPMVDRVKQAVEQYHV